MASSATGVVTKDPIQPPEMPQGLQTFWGVGQVVGLVAAEESTVNFPFNPSGSNDYQPYVAVNRIVFRNTVATQTGAVWGFLPALQWQRSSPVLNNPVVVLEDFRVMGDGSLGCFFNEWLYLGRVNSGQVGELQLRMKEVDTAVNRVMITGIIGDRPFVAPDLWRV